MPAYNFDIIVIGGGPAGYAAAIRAGQLKKRVLCVEKENLGGTCLNWGCIPNHKALLLEDGNFVRKIRTEAAERGITVGEVTIDFAKIIGRSRMIADKLTKGIAHLFRKYEVKHELGVGQLLESAPGAIHRQGRALKMSPPSTSSSRLVLAPIQLPGIPFDGTKVITSREAMTLLKQPKKIAIIGAGAIGCEFKRISTAPSAAKSSSLKCSTICCPTKIPDVSMVLDAASSPAARSIKCAPKPKPRKSRKQPTASG